MSHTCGLKHEPMGLFGDSRFDGEMKPFPADLTL